jgi:hypothetical protein
MNRLPVISIFISPFVQILSIIEQLKRRIAMPDLVYNSSKSQPEEGAPTVRNLIRNTCPKHQEAYLVRCDQCFAENQVPPTCPVLPVDTQVLPPPPPPPPMPVPVPVQRVSQYMKCQFCQHEGLTRIRFKANESTYVYCFALFIVTGFLCCIPFCIDSCRDVAHHCTRCNQIIALA